jgi:hypothetical protein
LIGESAGSVLNMARTQPLLRRIIAAVGLGFPVDALFFGLQQEGTDVLDG